MEEGYSGTESDNTADTGDLSQDEFTSIEVEAGDDEASGQTSHAQGTDSLEPYADEPLADEEWLEEYRKKQQEKDELEEELNSRLKNLVAVGEWCTCGNCRTDLLENISECYCCKELEGCEEALTSDLVKEDLPKDVQLKCITEHPGFRPVCLEKWSLRLASGKYRTRNKQAYKKTDSEERFLRAVSYREFSRLVYGYLGNRRIPLPACAYTQIRKAFPNPEEDEAQQTHTGFEMELEL